MDVLLYLLGIGLFVVAAMLAVPSLVFLVECLAALLPEPRRTDDDAEQPKTVVLVPAHDEAGGISATLRSLEASLGPNQRILVVADNCGDDTAAVARTHHAEVIERQDETRRGKGYAIVFGLDHLAGAPPEVVIIVDADCRVSAQSLCTLARRAKQSDRPVQAEYVLEAPETQTSLSVVSALAVLVKNKVRPAGLRKLGLPCHLTGSGMAFPWAVIRKAPPTGAYLVEDMLIGIELAYLGHSPIYCSQAEVSSVLPERDETARGQRRRWEHGHLKTLVSHGPALLLRGALRGRVDLIAMGLDLLVPPVALLTMLLGATTIIAFLATFAGVTVAPLALAVTSLMVVGGGVFVGWFRYGRRTLPLRYLGFVPLYLAWKIPLYVAYFFSRPQRTWERTERS